LPDHAQLDGPEAAKRIASGATKLIALGARRP
jgi:hypothetical protein